MRTLRRALLNIIRSPSRSVVVLVILAVSLGLALIMFEVHAASASQLSQISGNVGNNITVRPAGSSGFGGGGGGGDSTPLPQAQVDQLSSLPHVTAVQETVSTSYTGVSWFPELVLVHPVPFSVTPLLSRYRTVHRPSRNDPFWGDYSDGGQSHRGGASINRRRYNDDGVRRYFTADDANADVAVVGQTLATANNLSVGSEITIGTDQVQVIGIYTTGEQFGDNMIVMPIESVQRLYSINGATTVTVTADSAGDVNLVANGTQGDLGLDRGGCRDGAAGIFCHQRFDYQRQQFQPDRHDYFFCCCRRGCPGFGHTGDTAAD